MKGCCAATSNTASSSTSARCERRSPARFCSPLAGRESGGGGEPAGEGRGRGVAGAGRHVGDRQVGVGEQLPGERVARLLDDGGERRAVGREPALQGAGVEAGAGAGGGGGGGGGPPRP